VSCLSLSPDALPWTFRKIPYEFDPSFKWVDKMKLAMAQWEQAAGVTFAPHAGEANYIYIFQGATGHSHIGMETGRQEVRIHAAGSCLHELGHALGLHHEQSRSDRDRSITIQPNFVGKDGYHLIVPTSNLSPYDVASVMHYPSPLADDIWPMTWNDDKGRLITRLGANFYQGPQTLSKNDAALGDHYQLVPMPFGQGTPSIVQAVLTDEGTVLHLVYRDVANKITDLVFGGGVRWSYFNPNDVTPKAPLALGDPCIAQFGDELHCVYRDQNNQVADLVRYRSSWGSYANLSNIPGATAPVGDPCIIQYGANGLHCVYRDGNNGIADLFWNGQVWAYRNLNGDQPGAIGDPRLVVSADNTLHIFYRDQNNRISHLSTTNNVDWNYQDLMVRAPGAAPATGDPSISRHVANILHCVYLDDAGKISDIYSDGGARWAYANLSDAVGGTSVAPLAAGNPVISQFGTAGLHCLYRDQNNQISDISYSDKWRYANPSQLTGAGPAAGDPCVAQWNGSLLQVAYRTATGQMANFYFSNGKWSKAWF